MDNGNNSILSNYLKGSPVSLKVVNLRKTFGDNIVLKDISLDVEAGETLVILGKSGAGKSVFLKHIVGLESADSGSIYINNEIIDFGRPNQQALQMDAFATNIKEGSHSIVAGEEGLKDLKVLESDAVFRRLPPGENNLDGDARVELGDVLQCRR